MFTFKLTPDSGPELEVEATSRDVYRWEKIPGQKRSLNDVTQPRMSDLYGIARVAAIRLGVVEQSMTLDQFVDLYDLDYEEEEEPDPTPPGASPGD